MPRILLVDDDELLRPMLHEALERYGYEVVEACNGREALERYRDDPADLVLTDLLMPDKEGLETIRELRGNWPDVRIVAMSGCGRREYLEIARRIGAGHILAKPFSHQEMLDAIQTALAPR
jgi:CheY-like chemotaxis protein